MSRLFTPNTAPIQNEFDKSRFLLVWRVSIVMSVIFPFLSVNLWWSNPKTSIAYLVAALITNFSWVYLYKTKDFKLVYYIYVATSSITPIIMLFVEDSTVHFADVLWLNASIILALYGVGRRLGVTVFFINNIGFVSYIFINFNDQIQVVDKHSNQQLIAVSTAVLAGTSMITYIVSLFLRLHKRAEKKLTEINEDLVEKNRIISEQNAEKTVLLKEIHHRVKNNLQIVISLLRIQSAEIEDEKLKEHYKESISRVMAMSLIHQKLYRENNVANIELEVYLKELINGLKDAYKGECNIATKISSQIESISLDIVLPLGLLINELVSNSIKYAFRKKKEGTITLEVIKKGEEIEVYYSDSGDWREFDETQKSFGIELIDILVEQMNGDMERKIEDGTHYFFKLKG